MAIGMRRLTAALSVFVLLAALPSFSGCGGGSGADVPLVYTFKAGDTWVHEVTTKVKGTTEGLGETTPTQTDETTKTRVTSTVESVSSDGVATIAVTTETLEMTQNGQAQDLSAVPAQTVTITMDKTGRVLSSRGGDTAATGLMDSGSFLNPNDLGPQLSTLVFPAGGKAKVGEEWTGTSTIPLSGLDKELKVTTKAKVVGLATENGRQVATVEYATKLPMNLDLDLSALFSTMFGGSGDGSPEIVFKMATKGFIELGGTTKVDLSTGQAVTGDAGGNMNVSIQVTEAPEMFVPKDQRGPYNSVMTLSMQVSQVQ